ncbi:MAG TPA: hypothetical protein P5142_02950 [Spirochaetia bacterium]|nr:hypothetical protein [Spirochaetia bacterium]
MPGPSAARRRFPASRLARAGLALALALAGLPAGAQLLAPGEELYRLETGRFDIYYPAALSAEARRLASFADASFASLARRFPEGARDPGRIPVLLSKRLASPNGSFSPYPSDRIVLFPAPIPLGSELGSFEDGLAAVFAHELAHALSLRSRGPLWRALAALFGDPIEPSLWMAGSALIEGAAVAGEGEPFPAGGGGGGRARDPFALALLRQDLLEGRGKDFWQASEAWDAYPFGRLPYNYGGLFTARLLEGGGEERYAELWRRVGSGNILAGLEGGLLFKGAFEACYGEELDAAWSSFLESAAIREPVVRETRRLSAEPGYLGALAAGETGLYWADASRGAILRLEPGAIKPRRLLEADGSVGRLELSADGSRLLVSAERARPWGEESFAFLVDAARGRPLGKAVPDLREAAFAGSALVGLSSRGFESDLVLVEGAGRRVLLEGGRGRSFASPACPDGKLLYCLAREASETRILKLELASGKAWVLATESFLGGLRSLRAAPAPGGGNRLALSFAAEGELPRLALLDDPPSGRPGSEAGPTLLRQETLLSGSVFQPFPSGEAVYYIGRFSAGEYPCAYPLDHPDLSLRGSEASWIPFEASTAGAEEEALEAAPAELERASSPTAAPTEAPALPLLLRSFRYPSIPLEGDSAGLGLVGSDLAARLGWSLEARYNWVLEAAELGLGLSLAREPWTFSASLSDSFEDRAAGARRSSGASLAAARSFSSFPRRRELSLELAAVAAARAPAEPGSAYAAEPDYAAGAGSLLLAFSNFRDEHFPPFARSGLGAELSLDAEWPLPPAETQARPALAAEAGLGAALPFLGLAATLRAAASPDASVLLGPGGRSLADTGDSVLAARCGSYYEYASLPERGSLYAFAEASAQPLSLELQRRLGLGRLRSPLYLNRIFLGAGLRAALYGAEPGELGGAELLSSAFGRLALTASPLVGAAAQAHATAGMELSWAFRGDLVEGQARLAFLAGLSL